MSAGPEPPMTASKTASMALASTPVPAMRATVWTLMAELVQVRTSPALKLLLLSD